MLLEASGWNSYQVAFEKFVDLIISKHGNKMKYIYICHLVLNINTSYMAIMCGL